MRGQSSEVPEARIGRCCVEFWSILFVQAYQVSAGCDVDQNFVVIAVCESSQPDIEVREFEQTEKNAWQAAEWLLKRNAEIVILESTAKYHILYYETFREAGLNAQVINPRLIKSLLAVEGKSDKADAFNMARLAMSFQLRVSNMPDKSQKELRLNLRMLDKDKERRTQLTNSLQSLLTEYGCTIYRLIRINSVSGRLIAQAIAYTQMDSAEIIRQNWKGAKSKGPALITALGSIHELPDYVRIEIGQGLQEIEYRNRLIETREQRAYSHIGKFQLGAQIHWMTSAPAVNEMLALRIIAESGGDFWERYYSAEAFAKALGVAPSTKTSGGKLLKAKRSYGNIHVKRHLLNAVRAWLMTTPVTHPLKQRNLQYRERAGFNRSVSATANKIAQALWYMGKRGEFYNPRT